MLVKERKITVFSWLREYFVLINQDKSVIVL